jgi:hypothetical protein
MNTQRRPLSVSIISWYLVLSSGLSALSAPFLLNEPVNRKLLGASGASPVAVLVLSVTGGVAFIVAGVAMLKGRNWGRMLYLYGAPIGFVVSIGLYGTKLIVFSFLGLIFYGVVLFFLTRPVVSAYFSGSPQAVIPPTESGPGFLESLTPRKIIGALLLIPGGLMLTIWFMMILPMSETGVGAIVISGIFGFLTLIFIGPAVFLWGWKQWAGMLGVLFVPVGGFLLMSGAMLYLLPSMEEFHEQFARGDPAMMGQIAKGSLIMGIASLFVGGLLILLQRVKTQSS